MNRTKTPKRSVTRSLLQRIAAAPYLFWAVLFIIIPLIFVAYYSFTDRSFAFTLENIKAIFTPKYLTILGRSVKLALIATAICLLIGYPAAYFIARTNPKKQKILIMLIMLPMWMNFLIRTYAWMVLLQDTGIINSLLGTIGIGPLKLMYTEGAVVVGMVYDYLPYMILPIYSIMTKLDNRLVEAASDLGCNPFAVIRKVVIPQSIPGVISGIMMVFVPSISTFYISQKLGGGNFYLIGDAIETQFNSNNLHMAAAISFVLMVILLAGMFVMDRFSDNSSGGGLMP